jgi:hypothetical protein
MRIDRVKSRYIYAFVDSSLLDALCEAFHGFERGARRKARGAAAENRGRALGIGKNVGNVFPCRNSKTVAWRQARPIMRNVLFAKVISTPSSHPLDKDGPFGEVEYGCKAENKDAV